VTSAAPWYTRHRYPVEIIDHGVWLSFRFTLGFGEVEGDDAGPRRAGVLGDDPALVRQGRTALRRRAA